MEENNPIKEVPQEENKDEIIETYAFFSNPVKTNITIYNGIKLILEQINKLEERLERIEKAHGNQK